MTRRAVAWICLAALALPAGWRPAQAAEVSESDAVGSYVQAWAANAHCDFTFNPDVARAWLLTRMKPSHGKDEVIDLIDLSMFFAVASETWDETKAAESCQDLAKRFGPDGTEIRGALSGSGKPEAAPR